MLQALPYDGDELFTTTQAKNHLKVSSTADNDLIDALVKAVRERLEQHMGRAVLTRSYELWLDAFPRCPSRTPEWDGYKEGHIATEYGGGVKREIDLQVPRVDPDSVVLTTFSDSDDGDEDGTEFEAADNFIVDDKSEPSRLVLKRGAAWPTGLRPAKGIRVEFDAGYGDDPDNVPADILQAGYQLLAHLYRNRGDAAEMIKTPAAVEFLLRTYVIRRLK